MSRTQNRRALSRAAYIYLDEPGRRQPSRRQKCPTQNKRRPLRTGFPRANRRSYQGQYMFGIELFIRRVYMSAISGSNLLHSDFNCPRCGTLITCGIGFRAGIVRGIEYRLGDKIDWSGKKTWPCERPEGGSLKTIGYFECENLKCPTWHDCFPEVQEVLITIQNDVISQVKSISFQPGRIDFTVFSPDQEI